MFDRFIDYLNGRFFTYTSPKVVRLVDKRLSFFDLTLKIAAVGYWASVFLLEGRYLNSASPIGVFSSNLTPPALFTPDRPAYCNETNCVIYSGLSARDLLTSTSDGGFFVKTWDVSFLQENAFSPTPELCMLHPEAWNTTLRLDTAPLAVENYTLASRHTIRADRVDIPVNPFWDLEGSTSDNKGCLVLDTPEQCQTLFPGRARTDTPPQCCVDTKGLANPVVDTFILGDFMLASGLDLDAPLGDGGTARTEGAVVFVDIQFSNSRQSTFDLNQLHYELHLDYVSGSSFEEVSSRLSHDGCSRVLVYTRGVRFVVNLTGQLSWFSVQAMLLEFAALYVMLGTTSMITDILAFHVVPERRSYRDRKEGLAQDPPPPDEQPLVETGPAGGSDLFTANV